MKYISIIVIFIFIVAAHGLRAQTTLSNLALSSGTLSPAFSSGTTSYTASVTNATTSITVTPTKTNASASIQVNDVAVNSETASSAISLSVGSNTILIKVSYLGGKAGGIIEQSYTIVVTRQVNSNSVATLSSLVLSSGTLSPGFASATTSYTAGVTNATSSITVTPTKTDANATIRINGTVVNSGSASGAVTLSVGSNVITVTVTAQTGTIQSYTINVTRAVAADDHGNNLSSATTLGLNTTVTGSIETISDVDYFRITLTVPGSLTVQSTGSFDVEGWILDSAGTQLANNDDGPNDLQFVMNLPNATAGTYYLAVRHYNDSSTGSYGVSTSFTATSTANLTPYQPSGWSDRIVVSNVTGTTADASILRSSDALYVDWAVVNNGNTRISNIFYYELYVDNILNCTWNTTEIGVNTYVYIQDYAIGPLSPGSHSIRIKADSSGVIGETNESDNEYTKSIFVLGSSIASLSNLTISSGTLSPAFATGTTSYSTSVTNATSSITVTPTKTDANATIKVNGTAVSSGIASSAIPLTVGNNLITVAVTAQDGTTVRNYTVTVTRASSSIATLSNLALSSGTLSPAFASSTTSYTASVSNTISSITVTPTKTDANATIKVNGTVVNSGTASGAIALAVGSNVITVAVTAQDATTVRNYTLTVTRAAAAPEIAIEQTVGSNIADGGTKNFGSSIVGVTVPLTFTIKNTGNANLTGLVLTKDGANASDFTVTTNPVAPVSGPSGTTTFTVQFKSSAIGSRSAAIHLTSNDSDESPFDINLVGTGLAQEVSDFTYEIVNNTINITGYTGTSLVVTIPAMINGLPVTSIGSSAFNGYETITSVTIPNSVTSIGDFAFFYCSGLTSITIPSSVTSIGDFAFSDCKKLNAISVASGNSSYSSLDGVLFNKNQTRLIQCPGTKSGAYPISSNVTSIGAGAFYDCSGLTSITIPSGVTSIGDYAFSACTKLNAILVASGNSSYSSLDGVLFNKNQTLLIQCPGAKSGAYPISSSVTSIGFGAFFYCSGLTNITIPSSVTSIGDNAFSNCSGLTSISLPSGVTSIGVYAFSYCSGLTSITIPSGVTSIASVAFSYCSGLTRAVFTGNAPTMGSSVFDYAASGFTVYFRSAATGFTTPTWQGYPAQVASAVVTLSNLALSSGTLSPAFASSTTNYTASVTNATSSITVTPTKTDANATIKVNGTVVNSGTASSAIALAVGSNVITVAVTAQDATTVRNYTMTVTRAAAAPEIAIEQPVGSNISDGGTKNFGSAIVGVTVPLTFTIKNTGNVDLTGLVITKDGTHASDFTIISNPVAPVSGPSGTTTFTVQFKSSAIGPRSAAIHLTSNDSDESPFDINLVGTGLAQEVTDFTYEIVNNTINITGYTGTSAVVTIPARINGLPVTSIGSSAFYLTMTITSIIIPNSITSIGDFAFYYCSGLTSISIPSSVTSIGDNAFYYCSGLTSISIPSSVTSIGDNMFHGCTKLNTISVASGNPSYSSLDGVLFNKNQTRLIQCPIGKSGYYPISSGVTIIGISAFYDCSGLTSISIPSSVTSIGDDAFYNCTQLNAISVASGNSSYSSLDGVLFNKNQTRLIQCPIARSGLYTIPIGVTSIGDYAFSNCSGLNSISIPSGVTSIGVGTFYLCSGLTSITTPSSVISIGNGAFFGCSGLTSITIHSGVSIIENYAFYGCSGLTSISIPSSVTSIGNYAFFNCSGLTSIFIPSSVTSIGDSAFSYCSGLTSITIPSGVTSIGSNAFSYCSGLTRAIFTGNAPTMGSSVFEYAASGFTVYFRSAATGFTSPTWQGYSAQVASAVVTLSNLVLSSGTLSPAFSSSTTSYSASVSNATSSITVTPTKTDANATIKVNGTVVNSGTASSAIALAVGSNVITVAVTAQDATTVRNYTVTVTRAAAAPEIAIEQPVGSNIFDGGTKNFGSSIVGVTVPLTFTIKNTGNVDLTGLVLTKDGANASDFTVTSNPVAPISGPSGTTTFTVQFKSSAIGSRSAAIHLTSNDSDESPFDIYLIGTGLAQEVSDFTYEIVNNTITITGYTGASAVVIIPAKINGLPVTSIGSSAFDDKATITSVTIPNSVTSIGDSAFSYCSGLTSVAIPSSVTSIGDLAFFCCAKLNAISVNSGNSFYSSLEGVLFSKDQTRLIQCPGAKSGVYLIPSTVTSIEAFAFFNCIGLTSISIPSGVTSIGVVAFSNCSKLNVISVDSGNSFYGSLDGVLFNKNQTLLIQCPGAKSGSYPIPSSVTSIEIGSFYACSELTSITIPSGVTSIGDFAFFNCSGLTSISIPSSVTSIGDSAFSYCSGLTRAIFTGNAPAMGSSVFDYAASGFTVYSRSAATGFTNPTWQGYPAQVASAVASLSNLMLNSGMLSPTFATGTTSYTASVTNATSSITVTPTKTDANATIIVNGSVVSSGTASGLISLTAGVPTNIVIVVTAQDLTTKTYKLAVTRAGYSDDHGDSVATATLIPTTASSTIGTLAASDQDFFRVTVPGTGILIAWSESEIDTYGYLLNAAGNQLDEDNDSNLGANFRISAAVTAGNYYVRLKGNVSTTTGAYTLRTRFIPSSAPIQISYLEKAGNDVNLGFTGNTGVTYYILGSDDLNHWTQITTMVGTGAENYATLVGQGIMARRFFRVSSEAPAPTGFALIPSGDFRMGDATGAGYANETPVHTVTVSAFYMAKYETTKELWDSVRGWGINHGYTDLAVGNGPNVSKGVNHPVIAVNWFDILKWSNARSEMENLVACYTVNGATYRTGNNDAVVCNFAANGYRLPTESEWEKSARGNLSGMNFPWEDAFISHKQANFTNNGGEAFQTGTTGPHPLWSNNNNGIYPYTAPVGSFSANAYGLYDISGNVYEWCWDWYGTYASGVQTDPRGPTSGSYRIIRGGSWASEALYARCAYRNNDRSTSVYNDVGFRLARNAVP